MSVLGTKGKAVIGILTVIDDEFLAVQRLFNTAANIPGTQYFVARIETPAGGKLPSYDTVVFQATGQTNLTASDHVREVIEDFRPDYILLVGIAGGHGKRDVKVGDVVVADFVEDSEFFKLIKGKVLQRKRPYDHPSYKLRKLYAQPLCKSDAWHKHIDAKRPNKKSPHATIANLASGEKLLSDRLNDYQKMLMKVFDKVVVFEMEGFGVATQVFKQRDSVAYNPQYLIIRGVSDLVNDKLNQATRDKWRAYAACAAAAFAKELVTNILSTRAATES